MQLERLQKDGERQVTVFAGDCTTSPLVIAQWIKMLQLAKKWLEDAAYSPQASEND